jgi:hypothetical protein
VLHAALAATQVVVYDKDTSDPRSLKVVQVKLL